MIDTLATPIAAQLLSANATSLTTATPKTIAGTGSTGSIFLNAGTWLITGWINFIFASTTTGTSVQGGFNTTTNVLPTADAGLTGLTVTFPAGAPTTQSLTLTPTIVNVGVNGATYFLVGQAAFAVSTLTAYGAIAATPLVP